MISAHPPPHAESNRPDPIFDARPSRRRLVLYTLLLLPLLPLGLTLLMWPTTTMMIINGAAAFFNIAFIYLGEENPFNHIADQYLITPYHIEFKGGVFSERRRKIPLKYVRDVTSRIKLDQRLMGVGNITVSTTNGDAITLHDVTDPRGCERMVWDLVTSFASDGSSAADWESAAQAIATAGENKRFAP